jgi:predicted ribosome quality control (RQC) complex YloA/Tae2 family protein
VILPDEFEGGAPITIALDPARSAKENAARMYKEHSRLQRAGERIVTRRDEAARRLAEVAAERAALERGDAHPSLAPPPAKPGVRVRREPAPKAGRKRPYRGYRSLRGVPILVGRGADRNDELTFKVARGSDLWLHARDVPGAHVVVPLLPGRAVDEETLIDAATLAAHHSNARGEAQVDVTYTLRKHVRKPPRARPGTVLTASAKTVRVRLEPERLARLLATVDG